jgi:hypothetical protein
MTSGVLNLAFGSLEGQTARHHGDEVGAQMPPTLLQEGAVY